MKTWRALLVPAVCLLVTACTGHKDPPPAPAECPPPRQSGEICPQVVVWAKDPQSGACCEYGTPCNAPEGWPTFYSEPECRSD
ncbi:MAG TPA: hypothetical protein VNJ70_05395 [Thermoanaerobaculia bacterium]|nr:hypothetical protein [Thermoanaerobaculia bacterium]